MGIKAIHEFIIVRCLSERVFSFGSDVKSTFKLIQIHCECFTLLTYRAFWLAEVVVENHFKKATNCFQPLPLEGFWLLKSVCFTSTHLFMIKI